MSLFNALSTAQSGMMAAAQRVEAIAADVANNGAQTARTEAASLLPGARVRYLPLPGDGLSSDTVEQVTSLAEASLDFKLNALVFKTAAEMVRSLYDAVDAAQDHDHHHHYYR